MQYFILGVSHGDDIKMIFSDKNKPLEQMTPNDEMMKDILLDFFLSFAKSGYVCHSF